MTASGFTMVTPEIVARAAERHAADGFDFERYTPHKIAHDLIRWDQEFKGADYTQLVSAIMRWQRGIK